MSCCEVSVPLNEITQAVADCLYPQLLKCMPQPVTDVKVLPSGKQVSVTKAGKTELYDIDTDDAPRSGIKFDNIDTKVFVDDLQNEQNIPIGLIDAEEGEVVILSIEFYGSIGQYSPPSGNTVGYLTPPSYVFSHNQIKIKQPLNQVNTVYSANPQFGPFGGVRSAQHFSYMFKSNGPEDLVLSGAGQIEGDVSMSYIAIPVEDK